MRGPESRVRHATRSRAGQPINSISGRTGESHEPLRSVSLVSVTFLVLRVPTVGTVPTVPTVRPELRAPTASRVLTVPRATGTVAGITIVAATSSTFSGKSVVDDPSSPSTVTCPVGTPKLVGSSVTVPQGSNTKAAMPVSAPNVTSGTSTGRTATAVQVTTPTANGNRPTIVAYAVCGVWSTTATLRKETGAFGPPFSRLELSSRVRRPTSAGSPGSGTAASGRAGRP